MQFQNQNQTRYNLINSTNKNYKNKPDKILKQNSIVKRQNTIINNIVNKLKTNNSEIGR